MKLIDKEVLKKESRELLRYTISHLLELEYNQKIVSKSPYVFNKYGLKDFMVYGSYLFENKIKVVELPFVCQDIQSWSTDDYILFTSCSMYFCLKEDWLVI